MKTVPVLVVMACIAILFSCNEGGGMSATTKMNLATNDSIMKAYERGDFDKMSEWIAKDAVDHGGETGDVMGLDSIVAMMKKYYAMMPDMKANMTHSLADDEYVYTWSETQGTMMGKQMTMKSVDITKFKDGKAVEHWVYMDPKDIAAMMPQTQMPAMQMPADSSK